MANVKVRMQCGRIWLEVDAQGVKEAVKALGEYGEVFSERNCGQCGSEDLAYQHREHDGNAFYSMKCVACGAQLDFGQHRHGGTLFAKRKRADGQFDREHRGWYRWQDRSQSGNEGF